MALRMLTRYGSEMLEVRDGGEGRNTVSVGLVKRTTGKRGVKRLVGPSL